MDVCQKLHDQASVRALLWCLMATGSLDKANLKDCGFNDVECHELLKDKHGLLRKMKQQRAMALRMRVSDMAEMLRFKLAEHLKNAKKAAELSSLLRCLKSLPVWLFPEWEQAELQKLAHKGLDALAGKAANAELAMPVRG